MEYRKLLKIHELEGNPRFIKDDDFLRLCKSIKDNPDYFEARPIILSDRTGKLVIIAGNQRYKAALELGLKEVPTHLISGLTEEKENEIILRDNISNGSWDWELLSNWDVDLMQEVGLNPPDFDLSDIEQSQQETDFKSPSIELIIEFETLESYSELKEKIVELVGEFEGVRVKD